MVQELRSIVLMVIGIVAIGLSIKCYTIDEMDYESRSMYGGDAYTGIQNAAAATSKNVKELAEIVQFGFGSVLLVMGLTLVGVSLTTPMGSQKEETKQVPSVAEATPNEEMTKDQPADIEDKTEA
jgi:hypothetical protein